MVNVGVPVGEEVEILQLDSISSSAKQSDLEPLRNHKKHIDPIDIYKLINLLCSTLIHSHICTTCMCGARTLLTQFTTLYYSMVMCGLKLA